MLSVAVHNNLSTFREAILAGDSQTIEQTARESISRAEDASELIGQIGLIAMQGDSDGHSVLTLAAASELTRWLIAVRHVLGEDAGSQATGIPLIVQALTASAPALQASLNASQNSPQSLFPSELPTSETVSSAMKKAVHGHDAATVERLLFGLQKTGADYRTISVRIYDGIAQTFQEGGHSLQCAVRGSQILDAVQWGEDSPSYIRWLTPHMALHEEEPGWMNDVRDFLSSTQHSLDSYRTRLATPQNKNALPLRSLLLSDASASEVCQQVYDALIKNGASARGVGSVIALAASDLLQNIGDDDHDLFVRAAHGLIFASATRLIYTQVQEVEALPLLFVAATYLNALQQELGGQTNQSKPAHQLNVGGGLIAPALLESLLEHIEAQDVSGALATARRYIQLGHDLHALFGVIGLGAARVDATADQGHALQIVQAAGDEYLAWPQDLAQTTIEGFLHIALRAAALGKRNS